MTARVIAPDLDPAHTAEQANEQMTIEGKVFEVLPRFGLAHLRTEDGRVYGLNRSTPGIRFDELHEGSRVRCTVTRKFSRVLTATVLG